ncbi:MAG: AAA family ATPase [Candidatus Poribacteria bacterium]|nr:AAA family ATPase [Candidatus Poribacteria bacterium]
MESLTQKRCANCGFMISTAKFCGECGRPLDETDTPLSTTPISKAERRQLTVLFCDVIDSTALTEQLDPEDLRQVLDAYRASVAEVVLEYDGHIARYFGDGILVYFGYPIAHEDATRRAVQAGLDIVAGLENLNTRLIETFGIQIQLRLSIDTGLVVVWEVGMPVGKPSEYISSLERYHGDAIDIVGKTPNIAARMQQVAPPNGIVVGGTTLRLIEGIFTYQDFGTLELKGISQPVPIYQILDEHPDSALPDFRREQAKLPLQSNVTPLIGRNRQVATLKARWKLATTSSGQVVLIEGEAGIGKSRIVAVIADQVAETEAQILECRGSPYSQNSPLYPILSILRQQLLQFGEMDTGNTRLKKLEQFLNTHEFSLNLLPLLAELLEIEADYQILELKPAQRRRRTLQALVQIFLKTAGQKTLLLIAEDLHWADPSTLEFLHLLTSRIETAPILAILTSRSEMEVSQDSTQAEARAKLKTLTELAWVTQISLKRLNRRQVSQMITEVAGEQAIPTDISKQIASKTEGVPLFIEELTRMALEDDLQNIDVSTEIPATLQASLTARLDRLGSRKELVQLGATLGREWTAELLYKVIVSMTEEPESGEFLAHPNQFTSFRPFPEQENNITWLEKELQQLVETEILRCRQTHENKQIYIFKHPLIRETAYQALLKSTRHAYHRRIATVLRQAFEDVVRAQPELVAYHYTEGELPERAIEHWQQAGQRAVERSANVEGVRHLTQGLTLLQTLPETPARAARELVIQTTLGPALIATRGYAALEVEETYTRAKALLETMPNNERMPLRFPILFGLWLSYLVRAKLQTARELGEQCLVMAQQQENAVLEVEAHRALGATLYYLGELKMAQAHIEAGIACYDPHQHPVHAFFHYLADPGMTLRSYAAPLVWCLGYPEQAIAKLQAAQQMGEERPHPFSQVVSLHFGALLYQQRRDVEKVNTYATELVAICKEHGFSVWEPTGKIMKGWALQQNSNGTHEEGIALIQEGIAEWESNRSRVLRPVYLGMLAHACGQAGKIQDGLQAVEKALAAGTESGERTNEAELYRLKGELLLKSEKIVSTATANTSVKTIEKKSCASEHEREAEECFQKALTIAQHQEARLWELRTAVSLSKLMITQNRHDAADALLKPIYEWFTEGFETVDLVEARDMLKFLSEGKTL